MPLQTARPELINSIQFNLYIRSLTYINIFESNIHTYIYIYMNYEQVIIRFIYFLIKVELYFGWDLFV